jgi:hypothetical protein
MPTPYSGGCQCGAVRYEITGEPLTIYRCYCTDCQKQSGSAHAMSMITPVEFFKLVKGELKSFQKIAESGRPASCYFCADCGSRIYNARSSAPSYLVVKPGTLDDRTWIKPVASVWTRSAPPFVAFSSDELVFETQPDSFEDLFDVYREATRG